MPEKKPNVFLFFGEDDFSLRRKINRWKEEFAKKYSAEAIVFFDAQETPDQQLIDRLKQELSPSLFSSKKLIIVKGGLPQKASQEDLGEFFISTIPNIPKDYFLVFWQTQKPDGRLSFTKKFTGMVTVNEFELPQGKAFNSWLSSEASRLGGKISPDAAELLAVMLGRDLGEEKKVGGKVIFRKEAFDLWQANSEIQKLVTAKTEIGKEQVKALVRAKILDSVFALTDRIVAGDRQGAFQALENFLATSSTDEKATFIKIIGLLAEQVRSLLLISLLSAQGLGQDEIAEKLGWSAGRVFITTKNARGISLARFKGLLARLLTIDLKTKTSEPNLSLLIDQFIVEATKN